MLTQTTAIATAASILLLFSSPLFATELKEENPGMYVALAAASIHASIASCPKNIWTKEDEAALIHQASILLQAPSDEAITSVVKETGEKIISMNKEKGGTATFCQMMFEEKVKMMSGEEQAQ